MHPQGKRTHIKVSLGTSDNHTALQLSQSLAYIGHQLTNKSLGYGMRYDEIRKLLKAHFKKLMADRKQPIAANGRLSTFDINVLQSSIEAAEAPEVFNLPNENGETPLARFIAHYGLSVSPGTQPYQTLETEFLRAYRAYCGQVLEHDRSLDDYELFSPTDLPVPTIKTIEASSNGLPLEGLFETYVKERMRGGNWNKRSEIQYRSNFVLLCDLLGKDKDSASITIQDARLVKEMLQRIPTRMRLRPETRNLSIKEAAALPNIERMNIQTINKHLISYKGLFEWAAENGYASSNVFEGMVIKKGRKKDKDVARIAYTRDQIEFMVQAVLENKHGLIKKDFHKWGSLIGIYTGARLNEIAQLQLDDIRKVDGIWCFDINEDAEGSTLKTEASKRLVPIHSKLLELGLIEYVEELRQAGKQRLLHELTNTRNRGYGRNLGRWFNEMFLKKIGLKEKRLVFHSLRHSIVTHLLQVGVEEPKAQSIVGHKRTVRTARRIQYRRIQYFSKR